MGSHDFDTSSLDRLLHKLPKVTRVMMAGAVEGTDAYEPIGGQPCCHCANLAAEVVAYTRRACTGSLYSHQQ